ncbi:RsmF rRNA methyltransferase first C-terminal domain-containing protein [Lactobacillus sp. CC-MHH1034]|uniref:RsmB/NOP family class I SAM-dependent RNA methyltransferase n=1 Tax=Agrilactobacillus fermenti TaxID=2586909 RepID=UPI001E590510|nr:RsmF rRNA methyltransferase first C-terminal domain-containing protein [Agrilactobacillus fermenti]MCD2255837.1 RsmF rRNA methyltransferase first C-terminal domain-containing protein [Agrilactobacillus fermenti]
MNLPEGFQEKYRTLLGSQSDAFLASFNAEPSKGFRINPAKQRAVLPLVDTSEPVPYVSGGYYGNVAGKSIVHTSGGVYSQEPSAMYVGQTVAPQPGEMVLDLCAAPGGKSTHIASQMANSGLLVANEINSKRAKILSENIERFGLTNVVVTNNAPEQLAEKWPETFDRILVDAPCSGEGIFRKDHEAVQYWHPNYAADCAARQKTIVSQAVKMLKPGGTLIYSTCTFAPEEDEQIIAWILKNYPEFRTLPIQKYPGMQSGQPQWADNNPMLNDTVRLWPHLLKGEGHFIAKLIKQSAQITTAESAKTRKKKRRKSVRQAMLTKAETELLTDFIKQTFQTNPFTFTQIEINDGHVHQRPNIQLDYEGIRILRNGLNLGVFKKNRFEADHALALALTTSEFRQVFEVDEQQYQHYRHGEALAWIKATPQKQSKTFGLLTYQGLGFAIGKLVNQQLKNYYPKGLRD